jgi:mono/diheme cytochrome c family protein
MRLLLSLAAGLSITAHVVGDARADNPQRGRALAEKHCAMCHAIERQGESPLRIAPPFRSLHFRYPVDSLQEALAEGIMTGHPQMPMFRFSPRDVGDLIAYLKTLE